MFIDKEVLKKLDGLMQTSDLSVVFLPAVLVSSQTLCCVTKLFVFKCDIWSGNVKDLRTDINVFSLSSPLSLSVTPTRRWSKHPQHWRQICSGSRRPFSQGRPHWSVPLLHFTLYRHFYSKKTNEHTTEGSFSLQIVIKFWQCIHWYIFSLM